MSLILGTKMSDHDCAFSLGESLVGRFRGTGELQMLPFVDGGATLVSFSDAFSDLLMDCSSPSSEASVHSSLAWDDMVGDVGGVV